jgi:hypothetical protein
VGLWLSILAYNANLNSRQIYSEKPDRYFFYGQIVCVRPCGSVANYFYSAAKIVPIGSVLFGKNAFLTSCGENRSNNRNSYAI